MFVDPGRLFGRSKSQRALACPHREGERAIGQACRAEVLRNVAGVFGIVLVQAFHRLAHAAVQGASLPSHQV